MIFTTRTLSAVLLSINVAAGAFAQGNDNCALAVAQALNVGSTITLSGDNSTANGTGDFVVGSPYAGSPVYWVKFTTTECANVSVSYCGQAPVWANTFGILASTCPADVLVNATTFNNDDCGDGDRTYYWDDLPPGTWSVAVLNDPGNNSSGAFDLTVTATSCAENNDFCSQVDPQALVSGGSLTFSADNTTATGISDFDPNSPYAGAPVFWHAFTTTQCNDVTVSYCGQTPAWTNVFGILATDCPALNLVNTDALNTTECGDDNTTFHYSHLPAGTYFVPVLADGGSGSIGPYSIDVSASACVENNDLCAEVIPQPLASGGTLTFSADNSTAGGINDFDPNSPYFGAPVYWHAFTTDGCNTVTVSYCGQNPAWTNVFGILATDCPALNLVNATLLNTTDCGDGNTTFIFQTLAAGTYYMPVLADGNSGSIGPYTITVSAEACPQDNNFCDQVTPQDLVMNGAITFTGDNSNATGNGDFVPGNPYDGAPIMWHVITTVECVDLSVAYCGLTPAWGNTFGWLAIDCPADSLVLFTTFSDDTCGDGNRTYYWDELPAGTYAIPVVLDAGNNSVGPYSILVEANECLSTSIAHGAESQWAVFPNPTAGELNLRYGGSDAQATIELVDVTGRVILHERAFLRHGQTYPLRSSNQLAQGTYNLRVSTPAGVRSEQVVIR